MILIAFLAGSIFTSVTPSHTVRTRRRRSGVEDILGVRKKEEEGGNGVVVGGFKTNAIGGKRERLIGLWKKDVCHQYSTVFVSSLFNNIVTITENR